MLKGRMPRRWPMMSRKDSSVLELSIYSEASSCSGDEDDDDDFSSEWSEWEDPLWVKDDNLRRPSATCLSTNVAKEAKRRRAGTNAVSPLTLPAVTGGGVVPLRRSAGNSQLLIRKLSSIALPAASPAGGESISLSISLSFEGQESGSVSPLFSSSSSSSTTATSTSSHIRSRKVSPVLVDEEAECWSFEGRGTKGLKLVSDDKDHEDSSETSVAREPTMTMKGKEGEDGEGSIEEEEEAYPWSDEGEGSDGDGGGEDDAVEEKGMEYLLRKYFPDSLVILEQDTKEQSPKQRKEKQKQKRKDKKKKKKQKSKRKKEAAKSLQSSVAKKTSGEEAEQGVARRLGFSVDQVVLDRSDKIREKYKSLNIPTLELRHTDQADAYSFDVDNKHSSACRERRMDSGRHQVRKSKSERERRTPQSAREEYGCKSARELGIILRCRSREDVTDDEASPIAAPASPRAANGVRVRSHTFSGGPVSELKSPPCWEDEPSPRGPTKGKHSWITKREDLHPTSGKLATGGGKIERGLARDQLSVSTSSFLTAVTESTESATAGSVLSPCKTSKTGSLRNLLAGWRGSVGLNGQRRDAITAEDPTLASSSSSSSPSPSPSISSYPSSPSVMRRGSSPLNKAAGIFKIRTPRAHKKAAPPQAEGGGSNEGLASGDSRSSASGGEAQLQQKNEKLMGFKKSWREVKSYFVSEREVKTHLLPQHAGHPKTAYL